MAQGKMRAEDLRETWLACLPVHFWTGIILILFLFPGALGLFPMVVIRLLSLPLSFLQSGRRTGQLSRKGGERNNKDMQKRKESLENEK